jgi:hypothetical protein
MSILKNVTKEETVQYVLALLLQMLQGRECFNPLSLQLLTFRHFLVFMAPITLLE